MKKWMSILLSIAMVLSFTACADGLEEGVISQLDSESVAGVQEKSDSQEESKPQEEMYQTSSEPIEEEKTTVEVTIPKTMITDDAPANLTDEQKELGYVGKKTNEDGSVTYEIEEDFYQDSMADAKADATEILDGLQNDPGYTTIQEVSYNDDLTEITILVSNQMDFEQNMETFAVLNAGLAASTYQALAGNSSQKVVVSVKDAQTETIFMTMTYPDALDS